MVKFIIAIGSNIEQSHHVAMAKEKLNKVFPHIHYTHSLCTTPIDIQSDNFLNLLAWGETSMSLHEIEAALKEIEIQRDSVKEQKRQGIVALDLDLLLLDEMRLHEKDWQRPYIQELMQEIPYPKDNYILPAEWAPQSAIMLTWPHEETDWLPYLEEITKTYLELSNIITRFEQLMIVSPDSKQTRECLSSRLSQEQMNNVRFFDIDTNDTWARDHGPITLIPSASCDTNTPYRILDFKFNGWGEKFDYEKDNQINIQLYQQGAFDAFREDYTNFVLEGGSIESDGKGTIFTTSQCLLAPHRNQPMTQEEIEEQLQSRLHAQHIVWLDHGNLIGDDTDGHIDTIVRIAPHDTLLYVGCDNTADEQYEDFHALEKQLQGLSTPEGHPYRLIKLPMPDAIYDEGERLPATYANFLILNGAVIYPTYHQPEKDEEARQAIQQAFPDREMIDVDACTIIRQHGSIHCLTTQFPKGVV